MCFQTVLTLARAAPVRLRPVTNPNGCSTSRLADCIGLVVGALAAKRRGNGGRTVCRDDPRLLHGVEEKNASRCNCACGIYVYRILLGAIVAGVAVFHWLAVFSAFFFLSLALSKRTSELREAQQSGHVNMRRGYRPSDMLLLTSLGVTSGVGSVFVFCQYISGETATGLYRTPEYLWLAAPALLYWITRIWMLAERGELRDDPVVFAFRDRLSYVVAAWIVTALALAMLAPSV